MIENIDLTWVVVSLISVFGMMSITQLLQHNYYKKRDYDHKKWKEKRLDGLDLKKIARQNEIAIQKMTPPQPPQENQIQQMINKAVSQQAPRVYEDEYGDGDFEDDDEKNSWLTDQLLTVAKDNPELARTVIDKFLSGEIGPKIGGLKNAFTSQETM